MSVNIYGFSAAQWNAAKEQARAAMIAAVRSPRGMISYSELVAKISAIQLEAHDKRLDGLLEEVSKDEDSEDRGMLSVVVVHKSGDPLPGNGFFNLADDLGRDTTDRIKCWSEEFAKVQGHWTQA